MVNAAFKNRQEQRKDINKDGVFTKGYWTCQITQEVKHVVHLHPLSQAMRLDLHFNLVSGRPVWSLCNKQYMEDDQSLECDECKKPNKFGDIAKDNFPSPMLCSMGLVLEDIGQKRTSKKGTEYDVNPVQVILTPPGKEDVNLANLEDAEKDGSTTSVFWKYKRNDKNKFVAPSEANQKILNKQFDITLVEPYLKEYQALTSGQIQSNIMSAFANVKYDFPAIKEMGIVPVDLNLENKETNLDKE